MARPLRVVIIGAGIGGIAAAGALRKLGHEVELYERAAGLGEVGAGIQIGPNGVKVLRALGLDSTLEGLGCEPTNIVSVAWDNAHLRFRQPLKAIAVQSYGAPYLSAHRADLHRLLLARVPESIIHLNAHCITVSSDARRAVARLADGSEVEADIIVGADGIKSTVRAALFGETPARFTEQIGWRGIVPIECVPRRIGPDKSVEIDPMEYVGWIGPGGHVICYPIRGGKLYNMYIGSISTDWAEESWAVPSSRNEMMQAFTGWNEALLGMFEKIEQVFKWGIYDRDPIPHWTKGRVTLLGDAAHPMMPTLAQGASITLEDAYTLARAMSHHADDAPRGLAAYERERIGRASRVQLQARQQFENNRKSPAPPPLSRDWIFEHDATAEPAVAAE